MTSQPWDRQRGDKDELEPILWFGRFTLHRRSGIGRSLLGTFNKERAQRGAKRRTSVPGSWFNASRLWDWDKRAEAYDLAEMKRVEAEYQAIRDTWAKERLEFASVARKKLDQLIAFPVVRQTKTGGNTYVIEPLSVKEIKDIIAAYKGIDELARTTTRETLPTVKTEISGETTVTVTYSGNASPDEL